MSMHYILDDKHEIIEVDTITWGRWFETADRTVAAHRCRDQETGDVCEVSTVFLGLDHAFGEGTVPILFETLVFDGPLADNMDRYATWGLALKGHRRMLSRVAQAFGHRTEFTSIKPIEVEKVVKKKKPKKRNRVIK